MHTKQTTAATTFACWLLLLWQRQRRYRAAKMTGSLHNVRRAAVPHSALAHCVCSLSCFKHFAFYFYFFLCTETCDRRRFAECAHERKEKFYAIIQKSLSYYYAVRSVAMHTDRTFFETHSHTRTQTVSTTATIEIHIYVYCVGAAIWDWRLPPLRGNCGQMTTSTVAHSHPHGFREGLPAWETTTNFRCPSRKISYH